MKSGWVWSRWARGSGEYISERKYWAIYWAISAKSDYVFRIAWVD
jgi:hypothetical protein